MVGVGGFAGVDGSEVWPGAEQGEADLAGAEVVQAVGAEWDLVGGVRGGQPVDRAEDRTGPGAWVFQVRVVSTSRCRRPGP